MRILIDTNIILDVLCNRKPFVEDSSSIIKLCEIKNIDGYISVLSIPNIIYIMRKELTIDKTNEILNKLFLIFKVVDLKALDIKKAADLEFDDFEDALQSHCAKKIKADYIITRNIKDFEKSKIIPISPYEFLLRYKNYPSILK